jgi:hypothetical protein
MTATVVTDHLIAELSNKLRISGSLDTALALSGIDRAEYDVWARTGNADAMVKRLIGAVQEAENEVKLMREHQLTKYFEKNWQALAWWLERKYPDEYALRKPKARATDEESEFESLAAYLPKR